MIINQRESLSYAGILQFSMPEGISGIFLRFTLRGIELMYLGMLILNPTPRLRIPSTNKHKIEKFLSFIQLHLIIRR
jgi:hypothetical protein